MKRSNFLREMVSELCKTGKWVFCIRHNPADSLHGCSNRTALQPEFLTDLKEQLSPVERLGFFTARPVSLCIYGGCYGSRLVLLASKEMCGCGNTESRGLCHYRAPSEVLHKA